MSLFKGIKKAAISLVPSLIQIDFEKGGGRRIQEVAPYPKEVFWDDTVPVYKTASGIEYVRTPEERFENLPLPIPLPLGFNWVVFFDGGVNRGFNSSDFAYFGIVDLGN